MFLIRLHIVHDTKNIIYRDISQRRHVNIVDRLLCAGVEVNLTDLRRFSAIMYACQSLHHTLTLEIVDRLVSMRVDLHVENEAGSTAPTAPIDNTSIDIIRTLIDAGPEIDPTHEQRINEFVSN